MSFLTLVFLDFGRQILLIDIDPPRPDEESGHPSLLVGRGRESAHQLRGGSF